MQHTVRITQDPQQTYFRLIYGPTGAQHIGQRQGLSISDASQKNRCKFGYDRYTFCKTRVGTHQLSPNSFEVGAYKHSKECL